MKYLILISLHLSSHMWLGATMSDSPGLVLSFPSSLTFHHTLTYHFMACPYYISVLWTHLLSPDF